MWRAIIEALGGIGDAIAGLFAWFSRREQREAGRNEVELAAAREQIRILEERRDAENSLSHADADELQRLLRDQPNA